MPAFVSLFRGLNVGGKHTIKMSELKELHEALGLRDVTPYIQSGSVIFAGDDADGEQVRGQIERSFEERFGFHSDVLVRSLAELEEIIANNPFHGQEEKQAKWTIVMFLAGRPDEMAQEALLKAYTGPEELHFIGQELYIYYPDGMGRSKLSGSFLERKLKTHGTARNWNTVLKLQELMRRLVPSSEQRT